MAKKEFKSGIAALLEPTTTKYIPRPEQVDEPPIKTPAIAGVAGEPTPPLNIKTPAIAGVAGELIFVSVRLPADLFKKMKHHCAENRMKQQEVIINALTAYL